MTLGPVGVLIALIGIASVVLTTVGLASYSREELVRQRLNRYGVRGVSWADAELEESFWERVVKPGVVRVAKKLANMAPQATIARTRRQLELAGNPAGLRAVDFIGLRVMIGLIAAGTMAILLRAGGLPLFGALAMALLLGALGYLLPVIWLGSKIQARKAEILRALPDALDLLTISVEAGLGFDAALAKVVEKWDNALTREFARVLAEIQVGRLRRQALRDMAERVDVPELKSFIAAVIQADQLGASIGRTLHVQAAQMRLKRRQRAEEMARKAPIKMLLPLAFLILPALMIVIMGPAVISIKNSGILSMF